MKPTLDLFRLDGKIALVTGGAGVYGRHIVRALAEGGALVVVASRDHNKCCAFAKDLRRERLQVEGDSFDLAVEPNIRALRDRIMSRHGKLDVLFNNAVVRAGEDLRRTTAGEWEEAMRVSSTGLFLACQIFSEPMQAQGSGSIVNVSSIYGMVGPDFSIYEGTNMTNPAYYSFAKGGMINFTRYMASFLAPYNIRVNSLSPGGFKVDGMAEQFVRNYERKTLLARMAEEDDIKGPSLFLASDASRYITGQNIAVDGGWTAI